MSKPSGNSLATSPSITALFPAIPARACMRAAMKESLDALKAQQYSWEIVKESTKPIADLCRERLKALNAQRYKLFVQVTLAEAKGQGIRVASRMLWDGSSDVMASETYSCDLPGKEGDVVSIVASATVHAVYMP